MFYIADFNNYTKPELRERIKNRIKSGTKGGKSGQWSARKSQLLAKEYEKSGGGYKLSPTKNQKNLTKWTKEDWGYSSKKSKGKGRYRPKKVWDKLSSDEKRKLNQSKYKDSKKGKQFSSIPKSIRNKVQPDKN